MPSVFASMSSPPPLPPSPLTKPSSTNLDAMSVAEHFLSQASFLNSAQYSEANSSQFNAVVESEKQKHIVTLEKSSAFVPNKS